jgi:hypothetical protein
MSFATIPNSKHFWLQQFLNASNFWPVSGIVSITPKNAKEILTSLDNSRAKQAQCRTFHLWPWPWPTGDVTMLCKNGMTWDDIAKNFTFLLRFSHVFTLHRPIYIIYHNLLTSYHNSHNSCNMLQWFPPAARRSSHLIAAWLLSHAGARCMVVSCCLMLS